MMMTVTDSSRAIRAIRPEVHPSVKARTVQTLAERLFRKNLAAQYVTSEHVFLKDEGDLVNDSAKELKGQMREASPVHLTIAGIHLQIMEAAKALSEAPDVSDVDEEKLENTLKGVERDSLSLLDKLCVPE